jgi:hypothetical protein
MRTGTDIVARVRLSEAATLILRPKVQLLFKIIAVNTHTIIGVGSGTVCYDSGV